MIASQVCVRWKAVANDDAVWKHRIRSRFGLSNMEVSQIRDKKHWYLHKLCVDQFADRVQSMSLYDRLEFAFEENLFQNKIGMLNSCLRRISSLCLKDYSTWAKPLKLLYSPVQDNGTIFLFIIQTLLICTVRYHRICPLLMSPSL